MSDEIIKPPTTSDNSLVPALSYIGNKTIVKFVGGCLKQDKIIFTHGKTENIYIAYGVGVSNRGYDDYPTLEKCLFGAVKLTKNAYIDNHKYSGYGIGLIEEELFNFLMVDLVAM